MLPPPRLGEGRLPPASVPGAPRDGTRQGRSGHSLQAQPPGGPPASETPAFLGPGWGREPGVGPAWTSKCHIQGRPQKATCPLHHHTCRGVQGPLCGWTPVAVGPPPMRGALLVSSGVERSSGDEPRRPRSDQKGTAPCRRTLSCQRPGTGASPSAAARGWPCGRETWALTRSTGPCSASVPPLLSGRGDIRVRTRERAGADGAHRLSPATRAFHDNDLVCAQGLGRQESQCA